MSEDDRLERLLRSAVPPTIAAARPSRDLWPAIVHCRRAPVRWSWLDLGLAVVVAVALLMFPDRLWLLAYHL
jgi:hypothetical protein